MAIATAATEVSSAVAEAPTKRYEVAFQQLQTASTEAETITLQCDTLEDIEAQIAELLRPRLDTFPSATLGHNLYHYFEKTSITLDDLTDTLNCIPSLFDGGGVLTYHVQIPGTTPTTIIYISVSDPIKVAEADQREAEELEAYMASAPSGYDDDYDPYNDPHEDYCDEHEDEHDEWRCVCGSDCCGGDCGTLHCGCIDTCRGRCEDYDSDD